MQISEKNGLVHPDLYLTLLRETAIFLISVFSTSVTRKIICVYFFPEPVKSESKPVVSQDSLT